MAGATQGHTLIIRIHLDDSGNALRYGVNQVTVLQEKTPGSDDPAAQIHFNCIQCQSKYFISPKIIKMTELEIVSYASQTSYVKEEPAWDILETGNLVEIIPADPLGNEKLEENLIQNDSLDLPRQKRKRKTEKPKMKESLEANEQPFYTCDICNASIKYKTSIKGHMKVHLGHRYSCPKCPKIYTYKSHVTYHMKRAHKNEFREIVSYASKTSYVKEEPAWDILEIGNLVELLPADPLGNEKMEENHIQKRARKTEKPKKKESLESNERPFYTCDICNASIKYKPSVRCHMKIHLGHRFTCPKCPKSFTQKSYVNKHMKRAHKKGLRICKVCNWSLNCTLDEYYSHLRRVHPETSFRQGSRPPVGDFNGVNYPCIYCEPQKTFSSYEELEDHLRDTHMRRHACKICPKAFESCNTFSRHTETVHEKKTYDCSICGTQFRRKDVLLKHLNKHLEND